MKLLPKLIIIASIAIFVLQSVAENSASINQNHTDIVEFSGNPPARRTGAPNIGNPDEFTCTFCHTGSILSAVGVVDLVFNPGGLTNGYTAGETYPMEISVSSGTKSGFQLTMLNSSLQKVGDFVSGANTSTILAGGREYIRHSASNGITTFNFEWTAPATNMGDVMAFYTFNKANNNSAPTGDLIYKGSSVIPSNVPVAIGGFDENPNKVKTFWDASAKQIHLDYNLSEESRIVVNVQTLNGQLVQSTTIGKQTAGKFHHVLDGNDISTGVYIISVFVNNHIFNQKTLFN